MIAKFLHRLMSSAVFAGTALMIVAPMGCGGAQVKDAAPTAEAVCPVSGKTFTPSADSPKSEYDGKTYTFCCGGCKAKFDADPKSFVAKTESAAGEATCPVSGKAFTPTADSPKSEYKGKTYTFCCGGCKAKFDADPEAFAAKADAAAAQAVCPVTGERFTPTADSPKSEYKGKTYAFCCPGCKTKFDADPEKILAAPGTHPDCGGDCDDKDKK